MKRFLKRQKKVMFSIIATMVFATCMCNASIIYAEAEGNMNVDYHTIEEIKKMANDLSIESSMKTAVTYEEIPCAESPYKLGKLSSQTVKSALNTLNFIRYVAGIPYDVKNDVNYEKKAQAATVVNQANNVMTHYPKKPADMDEEFYNIGSNGAGSSNLGYGYNSLSSAICDGWMADEDDSNIDRVGHRRWCLNPNMSKTGFGVTGNQYAMYAFDFSRTDADRYTGVAWPAQNMPVELFERGYYGALPWSFSVGTAVEADSVNVVITRMSDGKIWRFSKASKDGDFYVENSYYGQCGCIIFRPKDITEYKAGDKFKVEITGRNLSAAYDVNFFSLSGSVNTNNTNLIKTAISTSVQKNSIKLKWKKINNAKGYLIYKKTGNASWKLRKTIYDNNILTYNDSDVKSGVKYTYKIISFNGNIKSEPKISKSIIYLKAPSITAKKVKNGIEIRYSKISGAKGYYIYRKQDNGVFKKIKTIKGNNVFKYVDKKTAKGVKYTYRVKAYNGENISAYINSKTIKR